MNLVVINRAGVSFTIKYDAVDHHIVAQYTWRAEIHEHTTYAACTTRRPDGRWTTLYMHRLLIGAPKGKQVDHRNHDGLDNRRRNLRLATSSQNLANQLKNPGRSSRFKGVTWHRRGGKWQAQIAVEGKRRYLGLHETEEAAARAYNKAAREAWGNFALLNTIPMTL